MGKGYKHGGSGGAALNFNVKTYPSETELKADKPRVNTNGVITTTTMTSWVFSATEPTEPEVGMVWISVGNASAVEFNALKKNTLQVYPISAKQYVGGKWEDKVAYSYQNGEWVQWLGNVLSEIKSFTTQGDSNGGKIEIIDNTIVATAIGVSGEDKGETRYFSDVRFDLSKYKTLKFHVKRQGFGFLQIGFCSTNTFDGYYSGLLALANYDGRNTEELIDEDATVNLSEVNTMGYFVIAMDGFKEWDVNTQTVTLTELALE